MHTPNVIKRGCALVSKIKPDRKAADDFGSDFIKGGDEDPIWAFPDEHDLGPEESRRVKQLKDRLCKMEDETAEKNRLINNQRKQLDDTLRALEDKERKTHELEILNRTMEANLHQLEGERRQYLGRIEEYSKDTTGLNDRLTQNEEDLRNLTSQLKSRTQENILLNKENKDLQRSSNQMHETIAFLEERVRGLERELTKAGPERVELEKKYSRSLDSLRAEVKAKHQEIIRLSKETGDLKRAHQDIQRVNENLELELDMLNTTNVSLQKKIEKLTLQNSVLEKKLSNRLVRFALALCSLFGWNPERKMKGLGY
jgi:chromosome segregation ATPase